jgi:uncharacterized surface protein with fasciclin (FAS1) repeats
MAHLSRILLLSTHSCTHVLQVLSYHVIPSGAVLSSQLQNGQQVPTALAGAGPLTVSLQGGSVSFQGAGSSATVVAADIKAGMSVVHVVDDVLLPAGVGSAEEAAAPTSG